MRKSERKPPLLLGALIVGFAAFAVVFYSIALPGVAWDEAGAISAATKYLEWMKLGPRQALSEGTITEYWAYGSEHPPFARLLAAAGMGAFHSGLGLLHSARIGAAASFGFLCALIFYLVAKHRGVAAGVFSAASFVLMPRILGHAMLAELDMAMAMTWFLTVALFVKAMESRKLWFLPGLGFGLALLTKINAPFILVPLTIWGLAFYRKKALVPLLATIVIGLAIFYAGWPWLWHHPAGRLMGYVADKLDRPPVETLYFFRTYGEEPAPWHYPLVMTFVTLPPGILAACIYGSIRSWSTVKRSRLVPLLFLNLAVIYGVGVLPNVPKYDGIRLFLPAFPFLACLAGMGLGEWWEYLSKRFRRNPHTVRVIISIFFAFELVSVALVYPFGLSYYSLFIGGPRGASALGFETTYWGEVVDRAVVEFLNRNCKPYSRVAIFPYGSQAMDIFPYLFDVREDITLVEEWQAPYDYLVVVNRQGKLRGTPKLLLEKARPIFSKGRAGVRLCAVYEVPRNYFTSPAARDTSEEPYFPAPAD